MGGRRDWATTAYTVPLSTDQGDILRVRLRAERSQIVRFVVQYEAVMTGHTYPVVRYDSAHGGVHRDTIDRTGRVIEKEWIEDKTYAEVVTEAIAKIKANWRTYREEFERSTP